MPAYGRLWITLTLAVVSAAGFVYWMGGMSTVRPLPAPAETIQASTRTPVSMAAPGTIPAALRVDDAEPLQLRLDRRIDTLSIRPR